MGNIPRFVVFLNRVMGSVQSGTAFEAQVSVGGDNLNGIRHYYVIITAGPSTLLIGVHIMLVGFDDFEMTFMHDYNLLWGSVNYEYGVADGVLPVFDENEYIFLLGCSKISYEAGSHYTFNF